MPNPGNTPSSTESPPANRFAKLSLITGTGAALILILMAATGEMVMQWIGEIESLVLLVFQFCGIVVLAICAIVFGTLGLRDIKFDPENEGGKKKAVTGTVLGAIFGALAVLGIVTVFSALGSYASGH